MVRTGTLLPMIANAAGSIAVGSELMAFIRTWVARKSAAVRPSGVPQGEPAAALVA